MKLIGSLTSPFVRKVRIVLAEKRIDCEFVVDVPWGATTRVAEFNPLGKVPALELDDGTTLFDSRVIVEYLDNATPVSHLIPSDPRKRILVKRWEALADGVADAAALIFLEKKRPAEQQSGEWIVRQWDKVKRGLAALSADLGPRNWCVNEHYSLADIATGCALGYLDFRFGDFDWRGVHPNLAALAGRVAQRAPFRDTVPVA